MEGDACENNHFSTHSICSLLLHAHILHVLEASVHMCLSLCWEKFSLSWTDTCDSPSNCSYAANKNMKSYMGLCQNDWLTLFTEQVEISSIVRGMMKAHQTHPVSSIATATAGTECSKRSVWLCSKGMYDKNMYSFLSWDVFVFFYLKGNFFFLFFFYQRQKYASVCFCFVVLKYHLISLWKVSINTFMQGIA